NVAIGLLAFRLLLTAQIDAALVLFDPHYRARYHEYTAVARAEGARIAALPGLAFCTNKVVCRMAGKPFVVDDFKTGQMVLTGAISQAELDELLRQRGIQYVKVDQRTFADATTRDILNSNP